MMKRVLLCSALAWAASACGLPSPQPLPDGGNGGPRPAGGSTTGGSSGQSSGGTTSSSSSATTGSGSSGTSATSATSGTTTGASNGGTTGSPCPHNMGPQSNPIACSGGELGTGCPNGYHCVNSYCVLNGDTGQVQVTLTFDNNDDLDLHVIEPLPNGGTCEIYYGDRGQSPDGGGFPSSCGAKGWLDRDSNAGCNPLILDGINTENVIYPSGQPAPSGTYTVRADLYDDCDHAQTIPFAIQVRANGVTKTYCDSFSASDADQGSAGAGRTITTFTVP